MDKFRVFWVVISLLLINQVKAEIIISEVMPCNISTYMDRGSDGVDPERSYNYPGWVEFFNNGDEDVSLKGYIISHCKAKKGDIDDLKFVANHKIQSDIKVAAKSYQVLFFDGSTQFYKHMPFKLDSDGGSITLYKDGERLDSLIYRAMESHISYGRYQDSEGYMNPTPKSENSGAYKASNRVCKPTFEGKTPGVVDGEFELKLNCATGGAAIYFTTDGSEPTKESNLYEGGIPISSTTVIRARAFLEDKPASEILTGSFLYLDKYHKECGDKFTLPIVSISADEDDLYDPEYGFLLVDGSKNGVSKSGCMEGKGKVNVLQEEWRRPMNFEYIENGNVVMSNEVEGGVIGGCSRLWEVISLKLKAGSKVGSTHKEFSKSPFKDKPDNKYKSFHLRNGGNAGDIGNPDLIRIRDGFMQSLTKEMNIDYQAYQPVAYYLNGKYMGLMGLRERTNEDYVEANYGLEDDEIDVVKTKNSKGIVSSTGTTEFYDDFVRFLEEGDPKSASYYEKACEYIDMDEYIDYQIFEQFIVNTDWPGNNAKIWRDRKGGKLRWIVYDTDFGFGLFSQNSCVPWLNTLQFCVGGDPYLWSNSDDDKSKVSWKVKVFYYLSKNPEFQKRFINKTLIHLGTTFSHERIKSTWDSLCNLVEQEHCAFLNRYDKGSTSLKDMNGAKDMLDFAKERPRYMKGHMQSFFDLEGYANMELSSNVSEARFMVNGDFMNSSSFDGELVKGTSLTLQPIAPVGYLFKHWEVQDNAGGDVQLISGSSKWKYHYESESPEEDWTSLDFDDKAWKDGFGKMGYRVKDTSKTYNTVLDFGKDTMNKYVRAYFRTEFEVAKPKLLDSLSLSLLYDDGYIIYLNGQEVRRKNIKSSVEKGEEIAAEQINDESDDFYLSSSNLVAGKNVLAVMLCQNSPESGDMTLRLYMSAEKKVDNGVSKDEQFIFRSLMKGDVKLKAIFEKSDCDQIVNSYSALSLNEVAPSNDRNTTIVDEFGIHSDWFEIYNSGEDTINLAGLYLSDDSKDLGKSLIPFTNSDSTKIAPKGFVRFWADNASYRGVLHADFKLANSDSSAVYLSAKCGDNSYEVVSKLKYDKLKQNASLGYLEENISEVLIFNGDYHTKLCRDGLVCMGGEKCATPGKTNAFCDEREVDMSECTVVEDELLSEQGIQIYPNPTSSILNIKSRGEEILSVHIYDGMGRLLRSYDNKANKVELDMSIYATGTYYLQIVTENEVAQQKVIKY